MKVTTGVRPGFALLTVTTSVVLLNAIALCVVKLNVSVLYVVMLNAWSAFEDASLRHFQMATYFSRVKPKIYNLSSHTIIK